MVELHLTGVNSLLTDWIYVCLTKFWEGTSAMGNRCDDAGCTHRNFTEWSAITSPLDPLG